MYMSQPTPLVAMFPNGQPTTTSGPSTTPTSKPKSTPFAKLFGGQVITNDGLQKSRLTPIEYKFPRISQQQAPSMSQYPEELLRKYGNANAVKYVLDKTIECYQQNILWGFTAAEIADLNALLPDPYSGPLDPGDLPAGYIVPCLQRDRWLLQQPPTGIKPPNSLPFMWINDPGVWDAIAPCLVLASYMLTHCYIHPLIDTILFGQREQMDPNRLPPDLSKSHPAISIFRHEVLHTLKPRHRALQNQDQIRRRWQELFEKGLQQQLSVGFMNKGQYAKFDNFTNWEGTDGFTHMDLTAGKFYLFLNTIPVRTMMMDGLSDAARLALRWQVAQTICHELIHAIYCSDAMKRFNVELAEKMKSVSPLHAQIYNSMSQAEKDAERMKIHSDPAIQRWKDTYYWHEPYLEDHQISELGWAFEHIVFGGALERMAGLGKRTVQHPFGYFCVSGWPRAENEEQSYLPVLTSPILQNTQTLFPIQISLIQRMQFQEFWDLGVKSFSTKLLDFQSVKEGTVVIGDKRGWRASSRTGRLGQGDENKFRGPQDWESDHARLKALINLTPDQLQFQTFSNQMMTKAFSNTKYFVFEKRLKDEIRKIWANVSTSDHRFFLQQLMGIQQIHKDMIWDIQTTEIQHGQCLYTERSISLKFNDECREFLDDLLKDCMDKNLPYVNDITQMIQRYEFLRMIIWDLDDANTSTTDACNEATVVNKAWDACNSDNFLTFEQIYDRIFDETKPKNGEDHNRIFSTFTKACLQIMLASFNAETGKKTGNQTVVREMVTKRLEQLREFRRYMDEPEYVVPIAWKKLFDLWVQRGQLVLSSVQQWESEELLNLAVQTISQGELAGQGELGEQGQESMDVSMQSGS